MPISAKHTFTNTGEPIRIRFVSDVLTGVESGVSQPLARKSKALYQGKTSVMKCAHDLGEIPILIPINFPLALLTSIIRKQVLRNVLMICAKSHPYPHQLPSLSFNLDHSHLIPPNLCTFKAYESTAITISNHSALSSHTSQWRPLARWEINVGDLLPSVQYKMNGQDSGCNAYELCRKLGCLYENSVINMQHPFFRPKHFQTAPKN